MLKGAEKTLAEYKDEFKRRGLANVEGERFIVTMTPQISSKLDTKAVREFLGEAVSRFEVRSIVQVIRVKAAPQLATAA